MTLPKSLKMAVLLRLQLRTLEELFDIQVHHELHESVHYDGQIAWIQK